MIWWALVVGHMFGLMGSSVAGSVTPPAYDYITTQDGVNITTQDGVALKTDYP
jgi:hypothetical protein